MKNYPMVKLGDVCEKGSSSIAQKDIELNEGEYPIYGASGKIKNVDFFKQNKEYIAVVKDGAGIGRTMLLPAYSSVIGTMQYILPKENVLTKYLYHAITAMNLAKYFSGATIPHIYFKDYKNEKLPLPNKLTQAEIVKLFDKIIDLISKRKEQLSKLDELAKSRFIEMFGNPVLNDKNWETKKMADVAPVKNYDGVIENKVWLLNLDMVESQSGEIIDYLYVDKSTLGSSICSFDESNVLYSKLRPYLNKVVLPECKGVATSELLPLRPQKELDRLFLAHLLRSDSFVDYISNKVAGAKMPRVSMGDFRNFDCILPPIELQISYKEYIQQLDKSKFRMKKCLKMMSFIRHL